MLITSFRIASRGLKELNRLAKPSLCARIVKSKEEKGVLACFCSRVKEGFKLFSALFHLFSRRETGLKPPLGPLLVSRTVKRRGFIWDSLSHQNTSFPQPGCKTVFKTPLEPSSGCLFSSLRIPLFRDLTPRGGPERV